MSTWRSINSYPGDQLYDDVPGTRNVSYWGEIGTGTRASTWNWTIMATDDNGDSWEEDSGTVATEAEAKAAVETWRKDNDYA